MRERIAWILVFSGAALWMIPAGFCIYGNCEVISPTLMGMAKYSIPVLFTGLIGLLKYA